MYLTYFSFRKIPYDIRLDSILHVACFWHVASLVRLQYTFCFKLFNFFLFLRVLSTDYSYNERLRL